ncbi:transcriptional regulator [Pseudoalteromonas sp. NBT06-2]|uniref:SirB2 family protein n=1 Tax=Pseudoalteromonas sp. NBT06-2 TaxID=2025950 RepID=UPI000BA73E94|nr:SirB2 family protein [Pseudoalteromonas sp. NBT06-2]PAJ74398.1 transcriptional regulator [Pseudoalteromonas sp. NBT06-2]
MSYIAIKHMHLTFVILSIVLFYVRAISRLNNWQLAKNKILFVSSHIGDTLLLISAFTLIYMAEINLLEHTWLLEKIVIVITYIVLGFILLKQTEKGKQFAILGICTVCLCLIGYLAGAKHAFFL